jgi:hypothetical protein
VAEILSEPHFRQECVARISLRETRPVSDPWRDWWRRADLPLVSPLSDLDGEAPAAERGDDQPAVHVGSIRLGMARRTERHQAVEIKVRAPLGALDDVVDLEGAPAATGLAPPAGAEEATGAPGSAGQTPSAFATIGPSGGRAPRCCGLCSYTNEADRCRSISNTFAPLMQFMCPKPIHVEMKTGWFRERSLAYLASGRPVLTRDTGFSERPPAGLGLVSFRNIKGGCRRGRRNRRPLRAAPPHRARDGGGIL